jgi:rubrerythrin
VVVLWFAVVRIWFWYPNKSITVNTQDIFKITGGYMDTEQLRTIEGLKLAIQIEIDGKKYYEEAAEKSASAVGKQMFEWLAGEEDKHRNRFEQIYDAISTRKDWPRIIIEPGGENRARKIFLDAAKNSPAELTKSSTEQDIVVKALDMEDKTYNLYTEHSKSAKTDTERNFYDALAAEERGHFLALTDYREYLIDPTGYFTRTERHSMDGG